MSAESKSSTSNTRLSFDFDRTLMKTLKTNEYKIFRNLQDRAGTNLPPSKSKGYCWPSLGTIAKDCNCSVSTVQRALKKLESLNLVRCEDRIGDTARYYPARASQALIALLEGTSIENLDTLPELTSDPGQIDQPTPVKLTTHPGQIDLQTYKKNDTNKNNQKNNQHHAPGGVGDVFFVPNSWYFAEEVGLSDKKSRELAQVTYNNGREIDWITAHWDYCSLTPGITNPEGLFITLILNDEDPREVDYSKAKPCFRRKVMEDRRASVALELIDELETEQPLDEPASLTADVLESIQASETVQEVEKDNSTLPANNPLSNSSQPPQGEQQKEVEIPKIAPALKRAEPIPAIDYSDASWRLQQVIGFIATGAFIKKAQHYGISPKAINEMRWQISKVEAGQKNAALNQLLEQAIQERQQADQVAVA